MLMIYSLLILMVGIALALLAFPIILSKQSLLSLRFISLSVFITIFSFGIYQFTGNSTNLVNWLNSGEAHYKLQEKFVELGGVDGMIARVKIKLKENPKDAMGWLILGKLFLMKHDDANAKMAFAKLREIKK